VDCSLRVIWSGMRSRSGNRALFEGGQTFKKRGRF
jgi:hypothetical protein